MIMPNVLTTDAQLWLDLEKILRELGEDLATTVFLEDPQSLETLEDEQASWPSPHELRALYVRHKHSIQVAVAAALESGEPLRLISAEARCLDWMLHHAECFALSHLTVGSPMHETIFPFPFEGQEDQVQKTAKWLLTTWWENGGLQRACSER